MTKVLTTSTFMDFISNDVNFTIPLSVLVSCLVFNTIQGSQISTYDTSIHVQILLFISLS